MEITVVDLPAQQAAAVAHRGPFNGIGAAFDTLGTWIGEHSDSITGPPLGMYLAHPEQTPPDQLRSYAAVPVAPGTDLGDGPVQPLQIAGGRYATATLRGNYAELPQAWGHLMAALSEQGLVPDFSRPGFEVYANDPGAVAEAELLTVLHMPVSAAQG